MRRRESGTLAALLLLSVALWIATPYFATVSNLLNVVEQTAIVGVIAIGMTFVILTGGIDLSVGSIVALTGVAFAAVARSGTLAALAPVAALLAGAACGALNGALVTRGALPPFIATLGTMSVLRGVALVLTNGRPISGFPPSVHAVAAASPLGIPMPALVLLALVALAQAVLSRTVFGRHVYAVGGNEVAAALSGVRVAHRKTAAYVVSGACSALAAVLLVARLDSAQPIAGIGYELDAIAAVVIGGASLLGGAGSALGTLAGALLLSVLRNGLNLLGVSAYLQQIAVGTVIVAAVLVDITIRRRSST